MIEEEIAMGGFLVDIAGDGQVEAAFEDLGFVRGTWVRIVQPIDMGADDTFAMRDESLDREIIQNASVYPMAAAELHRFEDDRNAG